MRGSKVRAFLCEWLPSEFPTYTFVAAQPHSPAPSDAMCMGLVMFLVSYLLVNKIITWLVYLAIKT